MLPRPCPGRGRLCHSPVTVSGPERTPETCSWNLFLKLSIVQMNGPWKHWAPGSFDCPRLSSSELHWITRRQPQGQCWCTQRALNFTAWERVQGGCPRNSTLGISPKVVKTWILNQTNKQHTPPWGQFRTIHGRFQQYELFSLQSSLSFDTFSCHRYHTYL